eukprot:14181910-Heterocapsa_arctica.AAC.1
MSLTCTVANTAIAAAIAAPSRAHTLADAVRSRPLCARRIGVLGIQGTGGPCSTASRSTVTMVDAPIP